jgi:predicted unusual protein kinase regulating ubiquinone biosynthesis (AarF/ABC1/UbiB family)
VCCLYESSLFFSAPPIGNILVIEEDDDAPSTTLGLIDYGQCKRLTPQEQVQVAQLVLAVANKESDLAVATAFRNLNITTKNDDTEFLANFGRLMFGPLLPKYMDHGWHRKLHQQDQVLYFPKELSMVYRTSLLLRGLAVSLQLNYTVGDTWKGHAQQAIDRNPHIVQELKLKQNSAAVSKETDTSIRDLTTDQPSITTRQQL